MYNDDDDDDDDDDNDDDDDDEYPERNRGSSRLPRPSSRTVVTWRPPPSLDC